MSGISRFVVLVTALMSLSAAMSSGAGAVTWHNTGNTAWTATGGPGSISVGGQNFNCTSSDATGTSPALTTTNVIATGTVRATGCTAFFFPSHVSCNYTLTGGFQQSAGTTVSGTTDIHCGWQITGVGSCTVSGTVPTVYTNPLHAGPGRFHVLHTAGGVSVQNISGCPWTGPATLTTQTLTVTSGTGGAFGAIGPRFTRTA